MRSSSGWGWPARWEYLAVAQFWKGMTLDPIGDPAQSAPVQRWPATTSWANTASANATPISLMAFRNFGFSSRPMSDRLAMVGVRVRAARPHGRPARRPARRCPLWLMILWIIVLGSVVPFLLAGTARSRTTGANTSEPTVGMLEPVGAGIIAWVLLGGSLNTARVIGSLIVLVGIVLAETARQGAHPSPRERKSSTRLNRTGHLRCHRAWRPSPSPWPALSRKDHQNSISGQAVKPHLRYIQVVNSLQAAPGSQASLREDNRARVLSVVRGHG